MSNRPDALQQIMGHPEAAGWLAQLIRRGITKAKETQVALEAQPRPTPEQAQP